MLLRDGRLAPDDDLRPDDEAADGRLLERLALPVARDGEDRAGEALRRVDEREPLDGARLEGRGELRLGVNERLPPEPRNVRTDGAAPRLLDGALPDGRGEVRLGVADRSLPREGPREVLGRAELRLGGRELRRENAS